VTQTNQPAYLSLASWQRADEARGRQLASEERAERRADHTPEEPPPMPAGATATGRGCYIDVAGIERNAWGWPVAEPPAEEAAREIAASLEREAERQRQADMFRAARASRKPAA
jgi:hypothetical protein